MRVGQSQVQYAELGHLGSNQVMRAETQQRAPSILDS